MSLTLYLGVYEIPYAHSKEGITTADVAEILEDEYHIMQIFYELHDGFVNKQIESSLNGAMENALLGGPVRGDPFGQGCSKIADRFKEFLSMGEMEQLGYPGVPTKASGRTPDREGGISHRRKHPYSKKNPARPSFIDTGEYQASFVAWVE